MVRIYFYDGSVRNPSWGRVMATMYSSSLESLASLAPGDPASLLLGQCPSVTRIAHHAERAAQVECTVLITGETGTGKEVWARLMHRLGPRHQKAFIPVNCAALTSTLAESQLFGHEKGAFTGASGESLGVFRSAQSGIVFLDEVGDMPIETQSKILRVLVEQRFKRLGGAQDVQVNVRVVSSTSRELRGDIEQGRFREDLFHRLNVVPLRAPGLAERREDIPDLAGYFVGRLAGMSGVPARQIGEDALAALQAADWPGNVRQLRNVIERILILATGDINTPVTVDSLPAEAWPSSGSKRDGLQEVIGLSLRDARERFEREYLNVQITRFGGNISRTAAFIGMERSALHRKLKSLGVEAPGRNGHDGAE